MADNFTCDAGAGGDTFGADDIGVKFPRVKLVHGANGTNDGDVATANPLPVTAIASALPTGAATETSVAAAAVSLAILDDWDESDRAKVNPIAGQAGVQGGAGTITALTQRVVLASDQTALTVPLSTKEVRCATGTTTQVADNAASVTVLASNANRLGASIQNDSSAVLYLKMGTTATATDYSVRMVQYAYFEVPFGYTGRVDGLWASDPGDGAARVTEYT